jgi:hypothetical protein
MHNRMKTASAITLILSFALAGCGGGGITPTPSVQVATPTPTPPTPECSTACSVDAPAPPSYGSSPPPAQIATGAEQVTDTPGGPTRLLGQSNVLFPALTTSVQFGASGVSAVRSDQSATVTVNNAILQVTIPAVNVNVTIAFGQYPGAVAAINANGTDFLDSQVIGLNYVALTKRRRCYWCEPLKAHQIGPQAQNLGAIWTLSDSGRAVVGVVGATTPH